MTINWTSLDVSIYIFLQTNHLWLTSLQHPLSAGTVSICPIQCLLVPILFSPALLSSFLLSRSVHFQTDLISERSHTCWIWNPVSVSLSTDIDWAAEHFHHCYYFRKNNVFVRTLLILNTVCCRNKGRLGHWHQRRAALIYGYKTKIKTLLFVSFEAEQKENCVKLV